MKNLLVLIFFTKTKLFFSAIQLFENNLVCVTQKPFLHNLTWVKWNLIGLMQSSPLVSSPIRFPLGSRKLFARKVLLHYFWGTFSRSSHYLFATFLWITCHFSILHSIFITSSKFTEIENLYLNFTTLEATSDKNLWKICNETSCTKVVKLYEFILWKLELQYVPKALKT